MHPPFPDSSLGVHAPMSGAPPVLPLGATAIVYCEGQFGEQDGKTANGLVRHSEKYEILSVIDSSRAGADTGLFRDGKLPLASMFSRRYALDEINVALDDLEHRRSVRPLIEIDPTLG